MKKWMLFLVTALFVVSLCGAGLAEDVTFSSRGVEVFATVVIPDGEGPFPLVVMAHGHGGSRDENIGFPAIAEALAGEKIASIRMDFPGCGDSTESFQNNTLSNMKQDVLVAVAYATEAYPIDAEQVGIFGYSMGGRIALELMGEQGDAFAAAALLAPAAQTELLKGLFGGAEGWDTMKAEAEDNGFAQFTTIYGQQQELSIAWFTDLEADMDPTQKAVEGFDGPVLVIYAEEDEAVPPEVSKAVADAFGVSAVLASGDGHSYGFYSDKTEVLDTVVSAVAVFFQEALQ